MLEFLKHVLNGQNQFASGGLLLMVIGALGAYLRAIPSKIWLWFVDQTTLSITVKDEDAAFACDVLYMMTTNKIEALDPALLRPGRIDYRLYLGVASEDQKLELYCRFFPQAKEFEARTFVEAHQWAETMADFQGLLLERAEKPAGLPIVERLTVSSPRKEDAVPALR